MESTYVHAERKPKNKTQYPWTDELPKRSIIISNFHLIDGTLNRYTQKYLKDAYDEIKKNSAYSENENGNAMELTLSG